MNNPEDNRLEGHNYDGIEELDNRLPNWWLGTLYLTMIFAAVYAFYFVIWNGPSQQQEYSREMAAWETRLASLKSSQNELAEPELMAMVKDSDRTTKGKGVFQAKCASCHGAQGEGNIGPNLLDSYWLYGGKATSIVKTIAKGVPEKGMPPWGDNMSSDEIYNVVAFIKSKSGVKIAGAKAPQGELEKE